MDRDTSHYPMMGYTDCQKDTSYSQSGHTLLGRHSHVKTVEDVCEPPPLVGGDVAPAVDVHLQFGDELEAVSNVARQKRALVRISVGSQSAADFLDH